MDEQEIIKGLKVVCKCKAVRHKTIKKAIIAGADSIEKVRKTTGANTGCGKMCTAEVLSMIEQYSSEKD